MSALKPPVTCSLPDDPKALKAIIAEQARRIAALEEYVLLEKIRKYGASSEKSPDQKEMFNEAELADTAETMLAESEQAKTQAQSADAPVKKPGRKPLPANLPRVRIEYTLPEADIQCPCGCMRTVIGEETSEQLEFIPAKLQVLVHARKKYACKACEGEMKTASMPPQPIPKSNASPGLLAHVAVSKYQDALPLYRQEAILQRSGIDIPRQYTGELDD